MLTLFTFVAALNGAHAQGDIRGEKVPIEIEVAPELLQKLTPEAREMVEATQRLAENHLWTWEKLEADLPQSAFEDKAVVLTREDLFRTSENGEIRQLMLGPNGERRSFEPEQLGDLRDRALIVVPSQKYPGREHVWRVRRFWMSGRKNVGIRFDRSRAEAYDQIFIQIPARFTSGKGMNVPDGTRRFVKGWRELLGAMVGALEMEPKYDEAGVIRELRLEAERDLRANGAEIDLRLYEPKTMEKANGIVHSLASDFERAWRVDQEILLEKELAEGRQKGLSEKSLADFVRERLREERVTRFHQALFQSAELEKLSPGLAELLVRRDRATRIATEQLALSRELTAVAVDALRAEYESKHPVLKWIPERTAKKLAPEIARIEQTHFERAVARILERFDQEGLKNEAKILRTNAAYYTGPATDTRVRLEAELSPKRVMNLTRSIWFSKNWTQNKDDKGPETRYWPTTTKTTTVDSDQWGWRGELALMRTHWAMSELNRALWLDLFTNGRFGYRAVFGKEPILTRDRMNPKTGEIEPDPSSKMGTWWSVRRGLADIRNDAERRFEAQPDEDILSKDVARYFLYTWYSTKTAIARELWDSANVLGFLGTTSLTLVGSALSPVLAPLYGAGAWLSDLVIVDSTSPKPWKTGLSPLVLNLAGRVGFGSFEVLGALVSSAVIHPVAGASVYAVAEARMLARSGWDRAWYEVFRRLYLPVTEKSFVTERISGPGKEQNVEYKISPKLALAALRVKLETEELASLEERILARSKEPVENARRQIVAPLAAVGVPAPQGDWYQSIERGSTRAYDRAIEPIKKRRANLPTIKGNDVLLRLARADVAETKAAAERMVEEFWKGREDQVDWKGRTLERGDARGLSERMLREIFGNQFLEPVDPADDTLVYAQETPDFGVAFEKMLDGIDLAPSAESSEIERALPKQAVDHLDPRGDARDVTSNLSNTCEKLLFPR